MWQWAFAKAEQEALTHRIKHGYLYQRSLQSGSNTPSCKLAAAPCEISNQPMCSWSPQQGDHLRQSKWLWQHLLPHRGNPVANYNVVPLLASTHTKEVICHWRPETGMCLAVCLSKRCNYTSPVPFHQTITGCKPPLHPLIYPHRNFNRAFSLTPSPPSFPMPHVYQKHRGSRVFDSTPLISAVKLLQSVENLVCKTCHWWTHRNIIMSEIIFSLLV